MDKRKRTRVATPTDLAGMAKCEMEIKLKSIHGNKRTSGMARAAQVGTDEHERFERSGGGSRDGRCFVASWACGPEHPTTDLLRVWRDDRLMGTTAGRVLVSCYYRISPIAVSILSPIPGAKHVCRTILAFLAAKLAAKGRGRP